MNIKTSKNRLADKRIEMIGRRVVVYEIIQSILRFHFKGVSKFFFQVQIDKNLL